MKRKCLHLEESEPEVKTPFPPLNAEWISATKTRNSLLNDHLLDYLNVYKEIPLSNSKGFTEFIMNQGVRFEEIIIQLLKSKFGNKVLQIGKGPEDSRSVEKFNETVRAIKRKIPIIYQGVLHNESNKTFGMPDIIIRKDYLSKIVTIPPDTVSDNLYCIIDIKFTTLYFTAKGDFLLNSGSVPAFKAQICVYNDALNMVTKQSNSIAYILGRRWIQNSTGNTEKTAFNKLGVIDYSTFDKQYIEKTEKAIDWYRSVLNEGSEWVLDPPCKKELWPNMKNEYDHPWRPFKKELAKKLGEITQIWQCGVKRRVIAHSNGIYDWRNSNSVSLGFKKKSKYYRTVNKVISINLETEDTLLRPLVIKNNLGSWKEHYPLDFYVDYETISNVTDDLTCLPLIDEKSSIIFLIGCGYVDPITERWVYKSFVAKSNTLKNEQLIITDWFKYMVTVKENYSLNGKEPRLIHWGDAEKSFFDAAIKRHQILQPLDSSWNVNPNWLNFLKVIKSEPVVVKGAFNFGLKSFAQAMKSHGFVQTDLSSDCTNGIDAMILAYNVYLHAVDPEQDPVMKDIIKYNEYDCKLVYEIVMFLRENNIGEQ